jgi:hypothetical protein
MNIQHLIKENFPLNAQQKTQTFINNRAPVKTAYSKIFTEDIYNFAIVLHNVERHREN